MRKRRPTRPGDGPPAADAVRVLVTGASGTFGQEICRRFTALGATVVGLDVSPSPDPSVTVLPCDLTDDADVTTAVAAALKRLGVSTSWSTTPGPVDPPRPSARRAPR